jgi:methylmalonyl-CoA mutase C-terminal domain/subunit
MSTARRPRVLLAKTSLDGHWRGLLTVSRALRDAGIEVVMIGTATADQIAAAAAQEDVDIVGLNVGGRVEVVERVIDRLQERSSEVPVIAGGTIAPWARKRLEARGVRVFPPGSSVGDIVDAVLTLGVI